jgi:hypothetical protein
MKALDELNNDQIKALIGAGYRTVDDLRNVSVDELVKEVGLETDLAQQIAQEVPLFKHKDFSAEHKHLLLGSSATITKRKRNLAQAGGSHADFSTKCGEDFLIKGLS